MPFRMVEFIAASPARAFASPVRTFASPAQALIFYLGPDENPVRINKGYWVCEGTGQGHI